MRRKANKFRHEAEVTVDDVLCRVSYVITPGEPMVRYYPDGSGYPGSPPEVDVCYFRDAAVEERYDNDAAFQERLHNALIEHDADNSEPL